MYLAFVACAAKAPITQKILDETVDLIDKAGSAENIRRWIVWTPTQLSLMELAEKLPRVVIFGGNGTGKTVMLESYALKLAKEQKEIIFAFATDGNESGKKTLLIAQMQVRFEKYQNVTFEYFNGYSWDHKLDHSEQGKKWNDKYVFIDELYNRFDDGKVNDIEKILQHGNPKSLWVVYRGGKSQGPEGKDCSVRLAYCVIWPFGNDVLTLTRAEHCLF